MDTEDIKHINKTTENHVKAFNELLLFWIILIYKKIYKNIKQWETEKQYQ